MVSVGFAILRVLILGVQFLAPIPPRERAIAAGLSASYRKWRVPGCLVRPSQVLQITERFYQTPLPPIIAREIGKQLAVTAIDFGCVSVNQTLKILNDHTEDQFANLLRVGLVPTCLRTLEISRQSGASGRWFRE